MRRSTMFWGTILIILGVLLLLDNLGLLGGINLWSLLWPGFLILLGIWVLAGTVFKPARTTEHAVVALDGATSGQIQFKHGAGRLSIHKGTGGSQELLSGDFAGGVDINTRRDGSGLKTTLAVPDQLFPFNWLPGDSLDWDVFLNQEVPISLEIGTGASESNVDLTGLKIGQLKLETGASNTQILLPEAAGETRVSVNAGAASVRIQVPAGVAARIQVSGGAMDASVDTQRFPRSGGAYQSADYDTAIHRADIKIDMGAGSVHVS